MSIWAIIGFAILGSLGIWVIGQILFGLALLGIASDFEAITKSAVKRK